MLDDYTPYEAVYIPLSKKLPPEEELQAHVKKQRKLWGWFLRFLLLFKRKHKMSIDLGTHILVATYKKLFGQPYVLEVALEQVGEIVPIMPDPEHQSIN